jgi:hypothetical protein
MWPERDMTRPAATTRFARRFARMRVTVIGVGRAGSFASLALGMVGVRRVRVFDHDLLDPERNLGVQLYRAADVIRRRPKVEALRELLGELCPDMALEGIAEAFPTAEQLAAGPVVLLAVDTMEARRRAAARLAADRTVDCLVDLRLGGPVARCHSHHGPGAVRDFEATLHSDDDSWGDPCANSPDPHVALAAAALAAASIVAYARGDVFPVEIIVDVGAAPWMVVRNGGSPEDTRSAPATDGPPLEVGR